MNWKWVRMANFSLSVDHSGMIKVGILIKTVTLVWTVVWTVVNLTQRAFSPLLSRDTQHIGRVAKCQLFYTGQNLQTKFYPKKKHTHHNNFGTFSHIRDILQLCTTLETHSTSAAERTKRRLESWVIIS